MTFPGQNAPKDDPVRSAEETLRLIACAPAPDGLVDRVQARLRTAPRTSNVFHLPAMLIPGGWMYSPALRGVAAAAIVCAVAGGGWQIYLHVQPAPAPNAAVMPARVGNSGGFSNAGAMRTPDTLNGPVVPKAAVPAVAKSPELQPKLPSVTTQRQHRQKKAVPAPRQ